MKLFFTWLLITITLYTIAELIQTAARAHARSRARQRAQRNIKKQLSQKRRERALYYQYNIDVLYYSTKKSIPIEPLLYE